MKYKKTIQDKAAEVIEQDMLNNMYKALETGYKAGKKIAGLYTTTDNFNANYVAFANVTKIDNGYELEDVTGGRGVSTIQKNKNKKLEITGFFIKDAVKEEVARFLNIKTSDERWWISVLSEVEYLEIKRKEAEDNLTKEIKKLKNDIDFIKECQQNLAIEQNTFSSQINEIKENQEEKRTMLVIISMILVFIFVAGLPIIAFLIDKFLTK